LMWRLVALRGLFGEELCNHTSDGRCDLGTKFGHQLRDLPALLVELGNQAAAGKWDLANGHEVKRAAEAIKVGANVGAMRILELFGGHEVSGADDRTALGQSAERFAGMMLAVYDPGDAHVEYLDNRIAIGGKRPAWMDDHNVRRLDVAMNQSL